MAFSSQSFKAPKIKKGNFSSPLSSGVSKISASTSAPKLKTSKISFIKKENSPIVEAVNNNAESLTQTNEILIEIQKQLAFDFANRIAEEKDSIKRIKEAESTRRFEEEEKSLEKTSKIGKRSSQIFGKVLTPVKGIFDKLVEFFGILGTGFVLNAAYKWLQNEGNREKVQSVIDFVTNNWKTLLGVFIGVKVFGFLYKLIRLGRLISSFFGGRGNRGNRGGGRGRGPSGPGGGFNPCSPVTRCLDKLKGRDLENLASKLATTKTFSPLFSTSSGQKSEGTKGWDGKILGQPWWSTLIDVVTVASLVIPIAQKFGFARLLTRLPGLARLTKLFRLPKLSRIPAAASTTGRTGSGAGRIGMGGGRARPTKTLQKPEKTSPSSSPVPASAGRSKGGGASTGRDSSTTVPFPKESKLAKDYFDGLRKQGYSYNDASKMTEKAFPNLMPRNVIPPKKITPRVDKPLNTSSVGGSAGNIAMLTLPAIQGKPPQIPTPAETATETPYIDSVNSSNPYMQLTPDIYGIAA